MTSILVIVLYTAFQVFYWMLIARIIMSWFPQIRNVEALRPLIGFIIDVTDPFLKIFRSIIPTVSVGGVGIDFSPFIAIITLIIVQRIVIQILQGFF